jgi:hypothetical protein
MGPEGVLSGAMPLPASAKKNSSRRNAWGNMSYADLITQAIQSAPEKRLTLSQIYEWMVQNVSYFKDKGDSNSSAGWKVNTAKDYYTFLIVLDVNHADIIFIFGTDEYARVTDAVDRLH